MSNTIHAFDFLAAPAKVSPQPTIVLFGPERFLKQLTVQQLLPKLLGAAANEIPIASFDGATALWRDVSAELSTISLFGGGTRVAIVDDADAFISANREKLEDYVAKPRKGSVLLLLADAWRSDTRLAKALATTGLQIECRPPEIARGKSKVLDEPRVCKWLQFRAKSFHQVTLSTQAAQAMLDLVGPEFAMLEQDLAKLALFANAGQEIAPLMVHEIVGGWRTKTAWELIDAAVLGQTGEAMKQLDALLSSGQDPIALMGAIHWSLRRFATAARIIRQSEKLGRACSVSNALTQAGFRSWPTGAMETAERQLVQLGRERSRKLYRWLLETDKSMKSTHSTPDRARLTLELLITKMSQELSPRRRPTLDRVRG